MQRAGTGTERGQVEPVLLGSRGDGGGEYLVVDQMFESNCKPVGGAEECLGGLQPPQCETV